MQYKILFAVAFFGIASAFPAKLLRVPKIYNALITTKEKLLPSEAYPASTGPVFQPIGLTGEPVLLNPEAFVKKAGENSPAEEEGGKPKKEPAPLVFYPRYSVYYPPQPLLPYQQPIVYTTFENNNPGKAPVENNPEPEASDDAAPADPQPEAALPPFPPSTGFGYVKNNSNKNIGVPDVPPPPPPVGVPRQEENAN